MCVSATSRAIMGCGKSRYPSPEGSEADVHSPSGGKDKKGSNTKTVPASGAKRKASNNVDKKSKDRGSPGHNGGKSSPYKKSGAKDTGSPSKVKAKANGASSNSKPVVLEVPTEMSRLDVPSRAGHKDFKSITANKIVRVTNSQIEFFRMLDDKIEQGAEHLTSGEVSEVSSIDQMTEYDGIEALRSPPQTHSMEN